MGARGADLRDIMIEYYAIVQGFPKKAAGRRLFCACCHARHVCVGCVMSFVRMNLYLGNV